MSLASADRFFSISAAWEAFFLPYSLAVPLLYIYLREMKMCPHKNLYTNVHSRMTQNCKKKKRVGGTTQISSSWWIVRQMQFFPRGNIVVAVELLSRVWLFYDPMHCSLPGSSVHGISQARVLESVAISFLSWDWTCISCIGSRILYHWATWEAQKGVLFDYRKEGGTETGSGIECTMLGERSQTHTKMYIVWLHLCGMSRTVKSIEREGRVVDARAGGEGEMVEMDCWWAQGFFAGWQNWRTDGDVGCTPLRMCENSQNRMF